MEAVVPVGTEIAGPEVQIVYLHVLPFVPAPYLSLCNFIESSSRRTAATSFLQLSITTVLHGAESLASHKR